MLNVTDLKVGDLVGVADTGFNSMCEIKTVAKRTATQVVLNDGSRWTRNGRKVGEGDRFYRAFLLTEQEAIERNAEENKKRKRNALVTQARDIRFKDISDEGLVMILQVAKDHTL